jgi:Predicted membrane protein (DUF2339)
VLPIARNPAKLAQLAELEGRMIWWAAVAGALIGWSVSYSGAFGFILGGLAGAGLGAWLRSEVRREIRDAVNQALAARPAAAAERWDGAGVVAESEPATPPSAMARAATPPPAVAEPLDQPWREELAAARDVREREYVPPEPSGPSAAEELVGRVRDWFLGGNTILRVGLVILFVGLVFLARLVGGIIPLEGRLALVGLAGAALLGFGLYKRLARPDYALHLQGAGVAVMYLTVYAAAKVWPVLPPGIAFGFMVVIASLGAALAVLQNSQTLALASFLGGYAVPVLLGGESKTPLPLFSYLTILNLAVLGIAWKKSWRPLNLLGFFASFGIATLWGLDRYSDQHFLICELFLAATVAIYLATAVLYAHNTPGKLGNFADSTLLFGTALTGFGLQAGMVHDRPYAAAWSALGFGAVYLGVTAWTMRRKDPAMRLMNESMLAIGVGFVTMAIPLALEAKWTSAAWALEGAGAFWVGSRQARWMPRAFGMTLQVLAALILFTTMQANISAVPFANNGFVGPLLIALPLLFTAWLLRTQQPHSGSAMAKGWAPAEFGLRHVWFLAGFFFAALALLHEITRALPAVTADGWPEPVFHWWQKGLLAMLAILGLMALFDRFGRAKDWATATWPGRASIAVLVLGFLYALLNDRSVLDLPDLIAWIAALGLHYRLLQRQDRAGIGRRWNGAVHTIGALLLTAMLAQCLFELIDRGGVPDRRLRDAGAVDPLGRPRRTGRTRRSRLAARSPRPRLLVARRRGARRDDLDRCAFRRLVCRRGQRSAALCAAAQPDRPLGRVGLRRACPVAAAARHRKGLAAAGAGPGRQSRPRRRRSSGLCRRQRHLGAHRASLHGGAVGLHHAFKPDRADRLLDPLDLDGDGLDAVRPAPGDAGAVAGWCGAAGRGGGQAAVRRHGPGRRLGADRRLHRGGCADAADRLFRAAAPAQGR